MFDMTQDTKSEYEKLMKIRDAGILRNECFEKWNKYELLQLIRLYYQYFNEHKNADTIFDINEYVVSGQYEKDRS